MTRVSENCSGQMHTRARYPMSGKNIIGIILGLVLGLRCLLENGNSKTFSQYFLLKLSFDKLIWVFAFCLQKFFGFLSKLVFQVQVPVIMEQATNFSFGLVFERKWNTGVKE